MHKKLMQMEVHIYSNVNVKSQAGNIWEKDITTTKKGPSQKQGCQVQTKKNVWQWTFPKRFT